MKKNLFSAILVLYTSKYPKEGEVYDQYVGAIKEMNEAYVKSKEKQNLTKKESKSWVKLSKLRSVIKIYEDAIKNIMKFTPQAVYKDWNMFNTLQEYVVVSLYLMTNALPPRRNLYANTKMIHGDEFKLLKEEEVKKNNWVIQDNKTKKFRFLFTEENYKTGWKYGDQIIKLSKNSKLNKVLKMWFEYNISPDHWLLINPKQKNKMSPNGLTKYLIKIFSILGGDKKISSSTIRKIYLSEVYKKDTKLTKRKNLAKKMGHDEKTAQLHYEKH
tara:strand:- start:472 stop:1287 length:816 start_codon:yes stop_codon:yes gene_type:complete